MAITQEQAINFARTSGVVPPGQNFTIGNQQFTMPPSSSAGPAGTTSTSSGGKKYGENKPGDGYSKQEWHGTKLLARSESGVEIRMGDTPGNREFFIKHPKGAYIHITDKGNVDFRSPGAHAEINMDNRTIRIMKDMTMEVDGNISLRAPKGELLLTGKSIGIKSTGGNIDINSAKNITQETQGDWSTNAKGKVNHTTGDKHNHTVHGEATLTYNGGKKDSTTGDSITSVSGDSVSMTGGEHSVQSAGTMGFGAKEVGIASTGQTSVNALGNLTLKTSAVGTVEATGKLQQKGAQVSVAGDTYIGQESLGATEGPKVSTVSGPADKAFAKV